MVLRAMHMIVNLRGLVLFSLLIHAAALFAQSTALQLCTQDRFSAGAMKRSGNSTIATGQVDYCSAAIALKAQELRITRTAQQSQLHASGAPMQLAQASRNVQLNATLDHLSFDSKLSYFELQNLAPLQVQQSASQSMTVTAQLARFYVASGEAPVNFSSPDLRADRLTLTGAPVTLQLHNNQPTATVISADSIEYDFATAILQLRGNVTITQGQQTITAAGLIYHLNDGSWETPADSQQRIQIIDHTNKEQP